MQSVFSIPQFVYIDVFDMMLLFFHILRSASHSLQQFYTNIITIGSVWMFWKRIIFNVIFIFFVVVWLNEGHVVKACSYYNLNMTHNICSFSTVFLLVSNFFFFLSPILFFCVHFSVPHFESGANERIESLAWFMHDTNISFFSKNMFHIPVNSAPRICIQIQIHNKEKKIIHFRHWTQWKSKIVY